MITDLSFNQSEQEYKKLTTLIPIATLRNIKRGRSLYWEENGTMNTSTMITIGVLSSLIVLSLIVTIIVISHRKVQILILTI